MWGATPWATSTEAPESVLCDRSHSWRVVPTFRSQRKGEHRSAGPRQPNEKGNLNPSFVYLAPLLGLSQDSVFLKYLRHFPFPPFFLGGGGLLQPFLNQLLLGFFHHLQSFFPNLFGELVSSCSCIHALVPSPCLVCGLDLVNLLLMKGRRRQ